MAEDFYIDDYGGGDYYNGGGGGDYYGSGVGDDFTYGYGFDSQEPTTVGSDDLFLDYLDYYLGQGYDDQVALDLADTGASTGQPAPIIVETYTPYLPEPVLLPDIRPFSLPYISTPFDPFQFQPPSIPFLPESQPLPPGVRLPPACAGGTYHPYPIGHAQQDICVPFPPAPKPPAQQTQQQQQTPKPPAQQQKPPTQQQQPCPATHCKHPQTGQCLPIPQGYARHPQTQVCIPRCGSGTVFDQATGRCVPQGQAISPLPSEFDEMFADLKKLPWWVWAGLAGVVVLTQRGGR